MEWNHQVSLNQPRCLKHRYNQSTCSRCFDICATGAISFGTELVLDEDVCTSCMLCTSVCPTDALTIEGFSETKVINTLAKAEKPILSCSERENLKGHSMGPCLGHLSVEHLASYAALLGKQLELNMTECSECNNSRILDTVCRRASEAAEEEISAVTDVAEVAFEDVAQSRRDLLGMLGIPGFRVPDKISASKQISYANEPGFADKTIPPKLHVLNLARESCTESGDPAAMDSHYYTLTIDETCDNCGACIAMCPTGALVQVEDSIGFNNASCSGCRLCVEFCPLKSMGLHSAP